MKLKKMIVRENVPGPDNYFNEGQEVLLIQDFSNENLGLNLYWKYCYGLRNDINNLGIQVIGEDNLEFVGFEEYPTKMLDISWSSNDEDEIEVAVVDTLTEDIVGDSKEMLEQVIEQCVERGLEPPEKIEDIALVVFPDSDGDFQYFHASTTLLSD